MISINDENRFVSEVSKWIDETKKHYRTEHSGCYFKFELLQLKENIILDFLRTPYRKPLDKGICFSIDQFLFREDALKSRLFSLLHHTKTIYARKTIAKRINKSTAKNFFNQNHIAGYAKAKFHYGLFKGEDLVAAISFAQGRNMTIQGKIIRSYEWIGFCSKNGLTITGGLSKLLNTFVKSKNPAHIVTFVDADWARRDTLRKLGFVQADVLPPLSFAINWEKQKRSFPSRANRAKNKLDKDNYPFYNGGYVKFQHFYFTK